ncbi:hypothetical protein CRUP_023526 [Coryphaenoides rupestris]|nr:hypothetical protein CRUP_023526 [Coryphaenoides rupestris]
MKTVIHNSFKRNSQTRYNYDFLDQSEIPSQPLGCTVALKKEACLSRLVQGLQVYKVLLVYVKEVYPDNVLPNINSDPLIQLLKNEMRHPERVAAVSTVEAADMLQGLDNLTTFDKKLTAHSILRKLHFFLIDSKHDVARKENGSFNQRRQ